MRRVVWLLPVALAATSACTYVGRPLGDDAPADDTPPPARYRDCADALAQGETASGVYTLDPDGAGAFDAYCDQTTDGGGWTLAMKIDGAQITFEYDSPLWTDDLTFNEQFPDRDGNEAKLATFSRVAADQVLIETASGSVILDPGGNEPLDGHVNGTAELTVPAGRDAWRALVPGSTLPQECLAFEGTVLWDDEYAVRIGLVAQGVDHQDNEGSSQLSCRLSYDGAIGVGLWTDDSCDGGSDQPIAAGNIDDGCTMPVFAYVYVRD